MKRKFKLAYHVLTLAEGEVVRCPDDIIKYGAEDIAHELQECLVVLGMNTGGNIILKHLVSKGGLNRLHCSPRDIIMPLLHNGCDRAVLMHNHPGGTPGPSEEDIVFTRKVNSAFKVMGMTLLDHVIVAGEKWFSFKKEALL